MKQYINKDAVVAEIKRQISAIDKCFKLTDTQIAVLEGNKIALTKLLSFINTLEAKEIDLSNSFDATVCKIDNTYLKEMDKDAIAKALEPYENGDKVKVTIEAQKEL